MWLFFLLSFFFLFVVFLFFHFTFNYIRSVGNTNLAITDAIVCQGIDIPIFIFLAVYFSLSCQSRSGYLLLYCTFVGAPIALT